MEFQDQQGSFLRREKCIKLHHEYLLWHYLGSVFVNFHWNCHSKIWCLNFTAHLLLVASRLACVCCQALRWLFLPHPFRSGGTVGRYRWCGCGAGDHGNQLHGGRGHPASAHHFLPGCSRLLPQPAVSRHVLLRSSGEDGRQERCWSC